MYLLERSAFRGFAIPRRFRELGPCLRRDLAKPDVPNSEKGQPEKSRLDQTYSQKETLETGPCYEISGQAPNCHDLAKDRSLSSQSS